MTRPTDRITQLRDLLRQRILVLDGAMGTMIQNLRLGEADFRGDRFRDHVCDVQGNNDLLILTQPDIIRSFHRAYLDAGADIIETNTFNSTSISQSDYQLESVVYDLNYVGATLAREAADAVTTPDRPRFVAGALGPSNRTACISPDVNDPGFRGISYEEIVTAYTEAIRGLVDGGADLLMVETVFDTLNCKAILYAIRQYNEKNNLNIPIMVSGTITDASGRTLTGQTTEAFWN